MSRCRLLLVLPTYLTHNTLLFITLFLSSLAVSILPIHLNLEDLCLGKMGKHPFNFVNVGVLNSTGLSKFNVKFTFWIESQRSRYSQNGGLGFSWKIGVKTQRVIFSFKVLTKYKAKRQPEVFMLIQFNISVSELKGFLTLTGCRFGRNARRDL